MCAPHLKVQAFVETSMNIALFALAAVMIVGGIVSVIQGFPFVRLESGLAMTIAGATTASAGAVVLGLAVVAGRLRGLERAFREAPLAPQSAPKAETGLALPGAADPGAAQRARPSLAATAASLGAGLGAGAGLAGAASTRPGLEPTFFDPAPPAPEPSAAEPLLPNLLPADAPHDRPEPRIPEPHLADVAPEPETRATEDDLFDVPAPAPKPHLEPVSVPEPAPALESAPRFVEAEAQPHRAPAPVPPPPSAIVAAEVVDAPAEKPEPTPEPPAVEPTAPVAEEPQVVGTYASGGNTYVMYSTGVIEADTPRGRFTFGSLDELKAFVEAGGETDSRGAA